MTLYTWMLPGGQILRYDRGDVHAHRVVDPRLISVGVFDPIVLVGSDLVFQGQSDAQFDLWVLPDGGTPRVFLGTLSAQAFGFAAGETDMFWLEGTNRIPGHAQWESVVAWTAPATTDPARVVRRRLGATPLAGVPRGAPGMFGTRVVYSDSATTVRIVDIADGSFWTVTSDPESWFDGTPVWVGPDDFALLVARSSFDTALGGATIYRIRYDSLGPPSPPLP